MKHVIYALVGLAVIAVPLIGPAIFLELVLSQEAFFLGTRCLDYTYTDEKCVEHQLGIWEARILWTMFFYLGALMAFFVGRGVHFLGVSVTEKIHGFFPHTEE